MSFDLEVIFTGLCLVCLPGQEPCASLESDTGRVYLVNATQTQPVSICGRSMDGDHRPLVAFDEEHMLPGSSQHYSMEPRADGGRTIVAPLDGIDLCVRTARSGNVAEDLPGTVVPKDGRQAGQRHPFPLRADAEAYDWIAYLSEVERRIEDQVLPYCTQINGDLGGSAKPLVISRVRIDGGTLMARDVMYDFQNWWKRLMAQDYLIWETSQPSQTAAGADFPKALPEQIVWLTESLPDDTVVLLQTCGSAQEPPRTLFRLQSKGKDLHLHVSNLPRHNVQSTAGPHVEHFRWFYRFIDWGEDGCSDTIDDCPLDISLPTLPGGRDFDQDDMWGVLSTSVHCPPGGSGSP